MVNLAIAIPGEYIANKVYCITSTRSCSKCVLEPRGRYHFKYKLWSGDNSDVAGIPDILPFRNRNTGSFCIRHAIAILMHSTVSPN